MINKGKLLNVMKEHIDWKKQHRKTKEKALTNLLKKTGLKPT